MGQHSGRAGALGICHDHTGREQGHIRSAHALRPSMAALIGTRIVGDILDQSERSFVRAHWLKTAGRQRCRETKVDIGKNSPPAPVKDHDRSWRDPVRIAVIESIDEFRVILRRESEAGPHRV